MSFGVLYISYDGMLEPLGKSQVLGYLNRLAVDRPIHLISFEKPSDWNNISERELIKKHIFTSGIVWHPLRYHKYPSALATLGDIFCGIALGLWIVLRYRLSIIHARSYVSSVMALVIKGFTGVKFIFDMRGFWADERVDGGMWPSGSRLYIVAKWFEKQFLLSADYVVSLTKAAVKEMLSFPYLQNRMPPFEVITTCADLELFRPPLTHLLSRQKDRQFILGYVGTVRGWYLFEETLRCFKLFCEIKNNVRLHIINRGEQEYIRQRLHALHINMDIVDIEEANHSGVAKAMQNMDAGIFFIKPLYSKIASAPTKLGEFLGCGIPCISNAGVGDMAEILEKENVGVALCSFDDSSMQNGIDRLIQLTDSEDISDRCRKTALKYFSLDDGVKAYTRVYNNIEKLDVK